MSDAAAVEAVKAGRGTEGLGQLLVDGETASLLPEDINESLHQGKEGHKITCVATIQCNLYKNYTQKNKVILSNYFVYYIFRLISFRAGNQARIYGGVGSAPPLFLPKFLFFVCALTFLLIILPIL